MFRVKYLRIDTLREHVIFIHESAVRTGNLGFNPLDRVRVFGTNTVTDEMREVIGILNFCRDTLIETDEIGLSEDAYRNKVELSMFVLACALKTLDLQELVDYTRAMIAAGAQLDFGPGPIADKHCVAESPATVQR
jgi:hypothetical protein